MRDRFVDTHCHLDFPDFDADRDDVVRRAADAGVDRMVTVGTTLASARRALDLAGRHPGRVFAAAGIHPNHTAEAAPGDLDALRELAADPRVCAVGETGLDFYRDGAPRDAQERAFRAHLDLAARVEKPVILHARQSGAAVLDLVDEARAGGAHVRGVFHCFTEGPEVLERALSAGLAIGISGIVTFPKGGNVRDLVPRIPDARLLLDSDSPFLAPVPVRGKRNEPAFVTHIAAKLAELRGVGVADIARITTRNAAALFGLDGPGGREAKIAYVIRNTLYLAVTNDCTNDCTFCARNRSWVVKGHDIRLAGDPSAQEVIAAMGDTSGYDEVCFCGFGEPTLRLEVVKTVADELKRRGQTVRLNTNGLGSLYWGRDIVPELRGRVDVASVSLNTADPDQYQRLCRSRFGARAYPAVCAFVRQAVRVLPRVVCTAVDMPGIDLAAARRRAHELGAEFRARSFVDVG